MPLEAQLQALVVPEGTEFPGTVQELLELIAQYEEITGLNPFSGINFGPTTPDASNRDRPWFKTEVSGFPVGWFSWSGSDWTPIPQVIPAGTTAERPGTPVMGQQYFDTTIHAALIFERSQWRTLGGSPGDVKFVKAATIEAAIALNPGWAQDPDSLGRAIGAAGAGSALTPRAYGETVGEETTTIAEDNLASHLHEYDGQPTPDRWQADGNVANAAGNLAGWAENTARNTEFVGDGTPISIMNPTIYYWALVKQ